jgi:hypothetical protein
MQAEEQRLLNLAIEMGTNLRTRLQGNEIELCFEQWGHGVGFREEAFWNEAHTGTYQHTINFDDEVGIETWMKAARQFLDELGVQYTVDHCRTSRCFHIADMCAHALFVEHADDGSFDRAADQWRQDLDQIYQDRMAKVVQEHRADPGSQRRETGLIAKPMEPER